MAYLTLAEMESRFGTVEILQLTDRDGDNSADAGVLETAIADAESLINNALRDRVTVPVATPSGELKKITADIVRRYLYTNSSPDTVKDAYNQAVKRLQDFQAGIGGIDGITEDKGTDKPIVKKGFSRIFTEESFIDY